MTSFLAGLFSLFFFDEKQSPASEEDESHLISYGEWFQWNKSKETIILNVRFFFSLLCVDDDKDEWAIKNIGKWNGKQNWLFYADDHREEDVEGPTSFLKSQIIRGVINLIWLLFFFG